MKFWDSIREDAYYTQSNLHHQADFIIMDACCAFSDRSSSYNRLPWYTKLYCKLAGAFYAVVNSTEWTATLWSFAYVIFWNMVHIVRRAICWKFGHKMVDCSTAGPDSGDMDCACERCGQYWDIPLY